MGQAWFYLTLWHGTPPELTSQAEVEVVTASSPAVSVMTKTDADAGVRTSDSSCVEVIETTQGTCDIITRTEVVWLVGRTVH